MATITSLERSLQNCSLNSNAGSPSDVGLSGSSSTADDGHLPNNDTALELNSHVSLPYRWEQCLDLKTGEIYYINWRTGMKAKEDPRTTRDYYSEEEEEDDEEDSSYDSEESSSESSPGDLLYNNAVEKEHVLVVGGCKSCLMYFMVPKQLHQCPKCTSQLLHFDQTQNASL
ncbi:hypothetical protein UlMin_039932 [Ulmus minor]